MSAATTRDALALLRRVRTARQAHVASRQLPLVGLACVAAALVGGVLAPESIAPENVGGQGGVTHWGGWPLERAFSIAVLIAAGLAFRVVEVAFRTDDAHALELLPLPGLAVAADRLALLTRDALLAALIGFAFVAPSALRPGGGALASAAGVYLVLTSLLSVALTFGAIAWAGGATTDEGALAASIDGRGERAGAIYHSVPGVAFGVAAFAALFAKLGVEEPLRVLAQQGALGWTNAASVALGIPVALALGLLVAGMRAWAASFHDVVARFREAEGVLIGGFGSREDAMGDLPSDDSRAMGRVLSVQLRRRHPMTLAAAWVLAAIGLLVGWSAEGTVGPLLLGALAAAWALFGVHPARRVRHLPSLHDAGAARWLMDDRALEESVRRAVAASLQPLALPLALPALGLGVRGGLAYLAMVAAALGAYLATHQRVGRAGVAAASGALALALVALGAWFLVLVPS